jgi:hypothetical protein
MANPDLTRLDERKNIISEIEDNENITRKRFEQRKFDIYRNRQAYYVLERLFEEFSSKTVHRMRKVLSINPCKRIIDQMGSLYSKEPVRHFSNVTEQMEMELQEIYHQSRVDEQMRLANRYYKLHDQSALWVVPKNNMLCVRALTPKDYDVIPDDKDPEKAYAYVMNVWDMDYRSSAQNYSSVKEMSEFYYQNDKRNQKIADDSDRQRAQMRYVWWTGEIHMTTDGNGEIIDEAIENPIKRLPFIDIASEKDFQFFVRRGNSVPEFTVDLLSQLSDLAEISRLQGHSQAIVYSLEEPKDLSVGPNKVMWLKQSPDGQGPQPEFQFASPSPDLGAGLEIINTQLKMFLSSVGLDPNTVSGKSDGKAFSSGIDHLLSNIDKFQASQEDMDIFRRVETELFDVMKAWSNVMQGVVDETKLDDVYQIGQIPEDAAVEVKYAEPQSIRTQKEIEESVMTRLDAGLLTKRGALMELYGFDEEKAERYVEELRAEIPQVQMASPVIEEDQNGDSEGIEAED